MLNMSPFSPQATHLWQDQTSSKFQTQTERSARRTTNWHKIANPNNVAHKWCKQFRPTQHRNGRGTHKFWIKHACKADTQLLVA
ncbi:hypothetical protein PGT21_032487 [Puccinia graminis f. sp. tritici]|uniref:Uncharacterized protein n=1 Tax=Puccinia graminis f. sp. tritici TaxID=56615 RepID=A0A5B0QC81_PUCGR|nr:hypothetical protein PGT21_032487 [Puccinia graminis f. sp. tritici]